MSFALSWELTNACHLRCKTCLPASGRPRPGELSTAQTLGVLRELARAGADRVLFTGGEPLFRPDFADVLTAAAEIGMVTEAITSGTLASRRALAAIKDANTRLSVSFDGARPETHDLVRGDGMFARAVAGCRRFAAEGIPFDLSVTISRVNVRELADVARLGRDLSCRRVFFSEVSRAGRAADNWALLALTPSQRHGLPEAVAEVAASVFGDDGLLADDSCWVTGKSLYLDACGRAYLCAEIAQRDSGRHVADLTKPDGTRRALMALRGEWHGHRLCLYESFASAHVSLIAVHDRPCAVLALAEPVAAVSRSSGTRAGREVSR